MSVICYYKNEPFMVNFKFTKFHCYQHTQSFLITSYNNQRTTNTAIYTQNRADNIVHF
jgi:hypothetical protein